MDNMPFIILYQSIGIIALIVVVLSFQFKDQKKLLILNATACTIWAIHFILRGAYSGVMLNLIAVLRGFGFAFIKNKKWRIAFLSFLVALLIGAGFITVIYFDEIWYLALITTIGSTLGTILFSLDSPKLLRWGQLLCISPAWLFYNIWYLSIGGIIGESSNMISVLVSFIRFTVQQTKMKKENASN